MSRAADTSKPLAGRVVVVTGGSSGVGLATAARFAKSGASVVLLARNAERLKIAAASVIDGSGNDRVSYFETDVTDPLAVRRTVVGIADRFETIDFLINVAGVAKLGLVEELDDRNIERVVSTNYLGPLYLARECIPLMKASGRGDIVNISSEITLDNLPLMSLYASSKAALEALSRAMTQELREHGIRVTLVVLGTIADTGFGLNFSAAETKLARRLWDMDGYERRVSGTGPRASADAVADVVEFAVTRPANLMLDKVHVRSV